MLAMGCMPPQEKRTYALNFIAAVLVTGVAVTTVAGKGGGSSKDWESESKDSRGAHIECVCRTVDLFDLVLSPSSSPIFIPGIAELRYTQSG